jgi:hypothetical protein
VAAALVAVLLGACPASATTLCKVEPTGNPLICPAGEQYVGEAVEAAMEVKSVARFKRTKGGEAGEVTCDESRWTGKFREDGTAPAKGGIETAEFTNGGKPTCPSTFFGKPEVELTLINLPYEGSGIIYVGAAAPRARCRCRKKSK